MKSSPPGPRTATLSAHCWPSLWIGTKREQKGDCSVAALCECRGVLVVETCEPGDCEGWFALGGHRPPLQPPGGGVALGVGAKDRKKRTRDSLPNGEIGLRQPSESFRNGNLTLRGRAESFGNDGHDSGQPWRSFTEGRPSLLWRWRSFANDKTELAQRWQSQGNEKIGPVLLCRSLGNDDAGLPPR